MQQDSYVSLAIKVLQEQSQGLTLDDLTDKILEKKGSPPLGGKRPKATIQAALYKHMKRHGDFTLDKAGLYWIKTAQATHPPTTKTPKTNPKPSPALPHQDNFLFEIKAHNDKVRKQLLDSVLGKYNGTQFEHFVAGVLSRKGCRDVRVTPPTKDKGIDIRAIYTGLINTEVAIQVKRYAGKNKVGSKEVRELRGSLKHESGMIICTSGFTKEAIEEASRKDNKPIALVDGKMFIDWLIECQIGVKSEDFVVLSLSTDTL